MVDISEGGVRIQTRHPLPEGEFNLSIEVSFLSGGFEGELILPCETVWSRAVSFSTRVYGIEFVASAQACDVLTQVLAELAGPVSEEEPIFAM